MAAAPEANSEERPSRGDEAVTRVPIRLLLPAEMPSLYATHVAVHELTGTWEVSFHRLDVTYALEGDHQPPEAQASCVGRIVLSDETMKQMLLLLGRTIGERIGLDVVPRASGDLGERGEP